MSHWDEAGAYGIDPALLQENLKRTPAERLRALEALLRFAEAVQSRSLSETHRERLAHAATLEEMAAYGTSCDRALPGADLGDDPPTRRSPPARPPESPRRIAPQHQSPSGRGNPLT